MIEDRAEQSRAAVAWVTSLDTYDDRPSVNFMYVAPALDAAEWQTAPKDNPVYVWRTDGFRLHAAAVPLDAVAAAAETGAAVKPFDRDCQINPEPIWERVDKDGRRRVSFNAQFLRDMAMPGADVVALAFPKEGGKDGYEEPWEAFGLSEEGNLVGYAVIMPIRQIHNGKRPDLRRLEPILEQLEAERIAEEEAKRQQRLVKYARRAAPRSRLRTSRRWPAMA